MELNLSDQPSDPFFAQLRRRHPDVDLVVLPPLEPDDDDHDDLGPMASDHEVAAALGHVRVCAHDLWHQARTDAEVRLEVRYTYGSAEAEVRAEARIAERLGDGAEMLDALLAALTHHGWAVELRPGRLRRHLAVLDDLDVALWYAHESGVVGLTATGRALRVGTERARNLVRAGRRADGTGER